jgi:hypothetical protein
MAGPHLPFALPPLDAVLLCRRAAALAAFADGGWVPYATPITMDAERRRLLNVDLTEPDVAWHAAGDILAVAHLEADRGGAVTHLEITAAAPVAPEVLAEAVFDAPGAPKLGGGLDAREWIWGPEAASGGAVQGVPVRLWVCLERAYGDRLWAIASVVQRG